MAPHVSRLVSALFSVGADAEALIAQTRAYDIAVPLQDRLRPPPRAAAAQRPARTSRPPPRSRPGVRRRRLPVAADPEMALAAYGCSLLDREATDKTGAAAEIESLKRWCAAHVHDPRFKTWVVFRFPENLDYDHLVQVQRPDPACRRRCSGPMRSCAAAKDSSSPTSASHGARC